MSIASENAAVFRTRFAVPASLLRFALRFDAISTALAGILLLLAADWLVEPLGPPLGVQLAHAVFLICYGNVVYALSWLGGNALRSVGIGVVVCNLAYTALAVLTVIERPVPLTTAGTTLVIVFGVYTALMADLQFMGLRRLRSA